MFIMSRIKKQYGDYICRRCINKRYHVNLQPQDCHYGYMGFMRECPRCRQGHHIVDGLSFSGRIKTLLH